ncbi:hypothetical protein CEXT_770541 [Caerostris extrusa]|uniref:Uncharacterized protein n=1 Tax=Caerostris extrusa TaxID=172846 RepID=A0AAV4U4C4_CAEEX|nr:hypothetical protein CEXT_770541 [Caerostris extrusa]
MIGGVGENPFLLLHQVGGVASVKGSEVTGVEPSRPPPSSPLPIPGSHSEKAASDRTSLLPPSDDDWGREDPISPLHQIGMINEQGLHRSEDTAELTP